MATFDTFKDFAAGLVTSGYKWLTSTLLTAQQSFAVRPYFTCQIVDDTIQPLNDLFSGAGNPLANGAMATAPDGTVFAVGLDGSNHVAVWWDTNLNAVAGVWSNKTVIDTDATVVNAQNQFSIAISDWVAGGYQISVAYFSNFGVDATNLHSVHQYSTDGGATFTKQDVAENGMPNTNYNSNPLNLSIAVAKPILQANGLVQTVLFLIKSNTNSFASGQVGYDIYYTYWTSGGGGSNNKWSARNANSNDWTIHSLSSYYFNGVRYVVFAGFHNVIESATTNQNYSLWVTSLLNFTTTSSTDLWSQPQAVMPIGSASSTNLNSFTFPSATVSNGMVYITFKAVTVDSISATATGTSAQVVTTHTNYMMLQSDNGIEFSYPSIIVDANGSEFNSTMCASFVSQGTYWYLGGANGWLWQFIQNNVVADVTLDIIGYTISESAGQPSTINVQIGNQNGQWVGASPTNPGAAAIAKNRKIVLWQGYYTGTSTTEAVPRNVYYIDDIEQTITGTLNNVTIIGRDWYKKLKTTTTKFAYQFIGSTLYSDIFDGTTLGNWNQVDGDWTEAPGSPPTLVGNNTGTESALILSTIVTLSYGALMSIFFRVSGTTGSNLVYAMYIDSDNWLRAEVKNDPSANPAWRIVQNIGGSQTVLDSGVLANPLDNTNKYYPIFVRRYDYYKFNFMTSEFSNITGNEPQVYDPATTSYLLQNSTAGEFDLSAVVAAHASWQVPYSVGFGSSKVGNTNYRYFQYATFTNPNNLSSVIKRMARLASIFSFKLINTFRESLYQPQFTGTFTVINRLLKITAGNQAQSNINQFGNGEISFRAKITSSGNPSGFKFMFRTDDPTTPTKAYYFHITQASTGGYVRCRFERLSGGTTYIFYNTPADVNNNPANLGSLNINLTLYHTYRIVMIDGWMYAFIDDVMVAAWNDDWNGAPGPTTGYWGFSSDANTTLQVGSITAPQLWKPIPTFAYNPGDDAESSIEGLIMSLRAWMFSDMFGRFKTIFLGSSDPSTYTYNLQLFQSNVDDSDKEFVSQVTVYGSGVTATARNTSYMVGRAVRDQVIIDYTITTLQDAQTRANNELINANQYQSQFTPKQVINVGAEMFDSVTIVNTGNNTLGVNGPTRSYAQIFNEGGGDKNSDYSMELDTGSL